jgi:spoIIIJ-associated protein
MADKVERTGKPVTIGQMSAYERRIIHIALKEDRRVRTQSRGDGYLRKILIVPARNASKKDQQ